ncbi:MAG TPA: TonB family protein [Pyrinomonadaceae bacterium]|nr:TonB family protein [Pyrinomonadaceae bacterium]
MKKFQCVLLFFTFIFEFGNVSAQQTAKEKGIAFYNQGNNNEAFVQLISATGSQKKDAEAWNYLGLASLNLGKVKAGRKALEKAVGIAPQNSTYRANLAYAYLLARKINKAQAEIKKAIGLDPQNAVAYFIRGTSYLWENKYDEAIADAEKTISLSKNFSDAYILESDGLLFKFGELWSKTNEPKQHLESLKKALSVLESCIAECRKNDRSNILPERKEAVQAFVSYFADKDSNISETDLIPLKVLAKPRANYTDAARQNSEQGTIKLAVLFASNGTVKYVLILKGLRYGLNAEAVRAARGIQFEPAKKDGKPLSVVKPVEYSFSIY